MGDESYTPQKPTEIAWSKALAVVTLLAVIVGPVIHKYQPESVRDPKSEAGLTLGFFAIGMIYVAALYSVRRARLWVRSGRLETWLAFHTWFGVLAVLFVFLHADWRFRPGAATAATILLILTTISGVVGWYIYIRTPEKISREGESIVTPEETYHKMTLLQDEADKIEKRKAKMDADKIADADAKLAEIDAKIKALEIELDAEFEQEAAIGKWLYVHIPLSSALLVVATVHAIMTYYL